MGEVKLQSQDQLNRMISLITDRVKPHDNVERDILRSFIAHIRNSVKYEAASDGFVHARSVLAEREELLDQKAVKLASLRNELPREVAEACKNESAVVSSNLKKLNESVEGYPRVKFLRDELDKESERWGLDIKLNELVNRVNEVAEKCKRGRGLLEDVSRQSIRECIERPDIVTEYFEHI